MPALVERSAAVLLDGAAPPERVALPETAEEPAAVPGELRRGGSVDCEWTDGAFAFTVRGALPRRAWCLPMSNGRFGYLAADCGLGCMWTDNARERARQRLGLRRARLARAGDA